MGGDAAVDTISGPVARDGAHAGAPVGRTVVVGIGVGATAALALGLTVRSLGWPLVHDAPLMHYIASRLLAGAAPYRDLFDMNFPGVYLVHLLGLVLFGPGAAGFRALDLMLLGGTVAGLVVALAPFGRRAAAMAVVLFWLYHLAGGAWRAGQRDFILCLPLAWMTAAAVGFVRSGRLATLALASLSLGAAVWIKPDALLLFPVLAALGWRRRPEGRARAVAVAALGVLGPAVAMLAWLWAAGALAAFLDVVSGYLIPLYGGLGREPLVGALRGHDLGLPVLLGLGLWAGGGLGVLWRGGRADARVATVAAGVVYGALHFVLQGKGWEYHLYPFALFAITLGAAGAAVAFGAPGRLPAALLGAALVVTVGSLGTKGVRNLDPGWVAVKHARARALAAALGPVVAGGGTVQVLDTTDGGVHALYLLGVRQPTRFLYDFHFYHDVGHPYVQRLRAELLAGLRARPPAAVVLFERGWPTGDYRRLGTFPELAAWLEAGYRLGRAGDGYRIYVERRGTALRGSDDAA